jgi:hypothetical protein
MHRSKQATVTIRFRRFILFSFQVLFDFILMSSLVNGSSWSRTPIVSKIGPCSPLYDQFPYKYKSARKKLQWDVVTPVMALSIGEKSLLPAAILVVTARPKQPIDKKEAVGGGILVLGASLQRHIESEMNSRRSREIANRGDPGQAAFGPTRFLS